MKTIMFILLLLLAGCGKMPDVNLTYVNESNGSAPSTPTASASPNPSYTPTGSGCVPDATHGCVILNSGH